MYNSEKKKTYVFGFDRTIRGLHGAIAVGRSDVVGNNDLLINFNCACPSHDVYSFKTGRVKTFLLPYTSYGGKSIVISHSFVRLLNVARARNTNHSYPNVFGRATHDGPPVKKSFSNRKPENTNACDGVCVLSSLLDVKYYRLRIVGLKKRNEKKKTNAAVMLYAVNRADRRWS